MSAASPSRLRLLDLFCGAGGCSVGYERAGFGLPLLVLFGLDFAVFNLIPFKRSDGARIFRAAT